MKRQMFTDGFEIIRDASVTAKQDFTPRSTKPVVVINVGDQHEYTFSPESRVSRALAHNSADEIAERMNGGDFFFRNGELVNFQYGERKGFVHTDEAIQALIDHVGYTDVTEGRSVAPNRLQSKSVRLSSVHSDVEIEIPAYADGGQLSSQLSFAWSPFQQFVNTSFELVRLICANGMTGLTSFLNNKIPLVNNWEEHLAIANKQIQNTVSGMIVRRMDEMTRLHATVRDCQRVVDYCQARLDSAPDNHHNEKALKILRDNAYIANPEFHLKGHYAPGVFNDRRLSDQTESHLSLFTLWNMLTEISTHTFVGEGESNFGIQKHANEIVFDRGIATKTTMNAGRVQLSSAFSNAEAALVGDQL